MNPTPKRFLIDARDLGVNPKGIHRVLFSLLDDLQPAAERLVVATTAQGREHVPPDISHVVTVSPMKKSLWEQWGLPRVAIQEECAAVYSHREAGPLWGPPCVMHVPEDPEVRWQRDPPANLNERSRRAYSRLLMGRSLRRAAVVAASSRSIAGQLRERYGVEDPAVIPLGVDHRCFKPAERPDERFIFHLGSGDPRDRTAEVVRGYGLAARKTTLPPLVIGGRLGMTVQRIVSEVAERYDVVDRVQATGWLTDEELANDYANALAVVQPASDEGFGLQPLEALAAGAPLIVTDAPAVRDVVGDRAALVLPSIDRLAEALVYLAENEFERKRLRQAGASLARGFTWSHTAKCVLAALESAAQRVGVREG